MNLLPIYGTLIPTNLNEIKFLFKIIKHNFVRSSKAYKRNPIKARQKGTYKNLKA